MLCRITDEQVNNPWDGENTTPETKFTQEITLYDLLAHDWDIYLTKNKKHGFDLTLEREDNKEIMEELGIHPAAIEGFAEFCRRFLDFYNKKKDQK